MTLTAIHHALTHRTSLKLLSCTLLVALADYLFFDVPSGWTLGFFGLVLMLAIRFHSNLSGASRATNIAAVATIGLCLALVETTQWTTVLMTGFSLITLALLPKLPPLDDARFLLRRIVRHCFTGWLRLLFDALMLSHIAKRLQKRHGKQRSFVRHWLLPCLMTGIFFWLFSKANPILSTWVNRIGWEWLTDYFPLSRVGFAMLVAFATWPLLRPKVKPRKPLLDLKTSQPFTLTALLFNERSIMLSLILFNLLFLMQNAMDVAFIWSGAALPQGTSYAQYAHQGAYPLIVTALLAALFVLIALKPGSMTENSPLIRRLVFAWVGQNIFLVISSIARTVGYIEEYSLTYLRVAALIWMALVALGLLLIIARIYLSKSNLWLINANSVMLAATLYTCCFVNFGSLIAWHNVTHASEVTANGKPLDVNYLKHHVGTAALPALIWFQQHASNEYQKANANAAQKILTYKLNDTLADWHRWSFRDYRVSRAIENQGK